MAKTLTNTERRRMARRSRGVCTLCGADSNGHGLCAEHREKYREKNRRRLNLKPWQPGGTGRIPIGRELEAERADIHKTINALRGKLGMRRAQCAQLVQEIGEWRARLKELRAKGR